MTPSVENPRSTTVSADAMIYPPLIRLVAGSLVALSRLSLPALFLLLVFSDSPINPLRLIRLVVGLSLIPGLAAAALAKIYEARVQVGETSIEVRRRAGYREIALGAVAGIEPWKLPLPSSGFVLRLDGPPDQLGIATVDPSALIERVAAATWAAAGAETNHPALVYGRSRARIRRRWWNHPLFKFGLFSLLPTLPLFRVHQIIAYGGPFGEYNQYGLGPYLAGFAVYWATIAIYLLTFAAILRVPAELAAGIAAIVSPARAFTVRKWAERIATVSYYAAVPLAVGLRFVPW